MKNRSDCWYASVCQDTNEDCIVDCIRYEEMKYLMDSSNIPKAKQTPVALYPAECDLEAFRTLNEIKKNIVEFVEKGSNLLIASRYTGNGKTSWAIKILLKYLDCIWAGNGFRQRALFIHVPTLLAKLKDFNDPNLQQLKDSIMKVDLVVWDDIASTGISNYDYNNLLVLIDNRLLENKANIYTSNVIDKNKFNELVGAKLTSRVYTSSKIIEFKGEDRRYD